MADIKFYTLVLQNKFNLIEITGLQSKDTFVTVNMLSANRALLKDTC